jgi:dTDP-4-dehydrorhamnose 3,5-epimerase
MIFTETKIKGAYIIDLNRLQDDRGFFGRSYCRKEFERNGLNTNMVQVNISNNKKKGTLRGLHMQQSPYSEAKLVRCTRGAIYDVIVDMRDDSETFKQWLGVELRADDYKMVYLPEGCAHGYLTLEDDTDVIYQVTEFYTPGAELGFLWNDPAFEIEWPVDPVVISVKDQAHPPFDNSKIDAGNGQKSIFV